MDTGKLIWLFRNVHRYEFVGQEAKQLQETISRILVSEETIRSEAIVSQMQAQYDRLVKLFYNNIIGYKHGFAMVGVQAAELDCYFIETSDGPVPIGYYSQIRPAEAATMVQKYLDKCREDVATDKNAIVGRWQGYLNGIAPRYEAIKNDGHPSGVRAASAAVIAVILLALAAVSVILLNPVRALLNWNDGYTIESIMENIPLLSGLGVVGWVLHFLVALIMIGLAVFLFIMMYRECVLIGAKNTTARLIGGMIQNVGNLGQSIGQDANGDDALLYDAARRGANAGVVKNATAGLIVSVEQQIQTAYTFVNKEKRKRKGVITAILIVALVLAMLNPLAYMQFLADGIQSVIGQIGTGNGGNSGNPNAPVQPIAIDSTYEFVLSDETWESAAASATARGGQLVSINDAAEFNEICALVDAKNANRQKPIIAFWAGATNKNTGTWQNAKWLDGEDFTYTKWLPGEPTGYDEDNNPEEYLLVFKVDDEWYYNDAPLDIEKHYAGRMGYIIETKVYAN